MGEQFILTREGTCSHLLQSASFLLSIAKKVSFYNVLQGSPQSGFICHNVPHII